MFHDRNCSLIALTVALTPFAAMAQDGALMLDEPGDRRWLWSHAYGADR